MSPKQTNPYGMYKNYFTIGWRTLLRNKGFSFINIMGLAVGMSITMLIGLWVTDEITFNRNHTHYDRIAQVYQHQAFNNDIISTPNIAVPLAPELKSAYPNDFKRVVRSWWISNHVLSIDEKKTSLQGTFM